MYESKTWKNRETEFPGRRRMTAVDGQEDVFDVTREEGLILEEGDAFDADTMNALEERVKAGFNNTCHYLYKATFLVDGWSGDGPYTQTATLVPVDGGPDVDASSIMLPSIGIDNSLPEETKDELRVAADIINRATKTFGDNVVTAVATELPEVDAEVYFTIKAGGV